MGDRLEQWGGELDLAVKIEVEARDIEGLPNLIEDTFPANRVVTCGLRPVISTRAGIDCAPFASSRSESRLSPMS